MYFVWMVGWEGGVRELGAVPHVSRGGVVSHTQQDILVDFLEQTFFQRIIVITMNVFNKIFVIAEPRPELSRTFFIGL